MIKVVRSGGQTGADQAGIVAAAKCGLQTCGLMPAGFKTLDGSWAFAKMYNMEEDDTSSYKSRTYKNVELSDATIRLAVSFTTPGERCTLNAIKLYKKPYFDVDLNNPTHYCEVARWLLDGKFVHINIAGNAEDKSHLLGRSIFQTALEYLIQVFLSTGCTERQS